MSVKPLVVWQIHDEKPGHRNQLLGLIQALADIVQVDTHEIRAPSRTSMVSALFSKRFGPGEQLPQPDLIVGAGHSTHFAVLAARRAHGGKAIVLMKPSLPTSLFDLSIVPVHDRVAESSGVIQTQGVLNKVRPSISHDASTGLMLIGGPSSAHRWSDEQMVEQIDNITGSMPLVSWQLTTSRRTPESFLTLLSQRSLPNLAAIPHQTTSASWVPDALAKSSQAWVTEDSVSMVYEALTSGAAVGVLEVPSVKRGRVAEGVESLVEGGWVTRFSNWQPGVGLLAPPEQLDEARRCAEIIVRRFVSQAAA